MTAFALIMGITWLIAGALTLWIGIKAKNGTLQKNFVAGIRTSKLLASEENWRRGHQAAAPFLIAASLPLIAGGIACVFLDDPTINLISIAVVALLLIFVLVGTARAHAAVK